MSELLAFFRRISRVNFSSIIRVRSVIACNTETASLVVLSSFTIGDIVALRATLFMGTQLAPVI